MILIYADVITMTKQEQVINAKQATCEIMNLFSDYGSNKCDRELVTQTSHMVQCAMLAMQENADQELILGAFLHDIGHLLRHKKRAESGDDFRAANNDKTSILYLKEKGFGERICAVVEGHEAARRYLAATDESYSSNLSAADWEALLWQGGPMTMEEAEAFQKNPYFGEIIQVKLWDENAKDHNAVLMSVSVFKNYIEDYLSHRN